jgi:16S rRNA U516 pseudouridylate synthase RsuA-like enzyme
MRVYLIDSTTNTLVNQFDNVVDIQDNYVTTEVGEVRGKYYRSSEDQYFALSKPKDVVSDTDEESTQIEPDVIDV